jgi:hypothetical protein
VRHQSFGTITIVFVSKRPYLLETGAANPSARTLNTSEVEMGEMMRFVIAHEVGHAWFST